MTWAPHPFGPVVHLPFDGDRYDPDPPRLRPRAGFGDQVPLREQEEER